MPLPRLGKLLLKHACPKCGSEKVKSASWFCAIGSYKCERCKKTVVMTYDMKLRLYARYAHQTSDPDALPSTEASNRLRG